MGEASGDQSKDCGANSVPTMDLSKVVWEASLHYEGDLAPEIPFKSTDLLENAVTRLVKFYNAEYDKAEQASPGSTAKWILPESAEKGVKNVRKIVDGDIIQLRRKWSDILDKSYFTRCAFVYDSKLAKLHLDSSEPEFIDKLRGMEQKEGVPETVGDFANMDRVSQSETKYVTLQISRYGRHMGRPRRKRGRGRSITAVWEDKLPAEKEDGSQQNA